MTDGSLRKKAVRFLDRVQAVHEVGHTYVAVQAGLIVSKTFLGVPGQTGGGTLLATKQNLQGICLAEAHVLLAFADGLAEERLLAGDKRQLELMKRANAATGANQHDECAKEVAIRTLLLNNYPGTHAQIEQESRMKATKMVHEDWESVCTLSAHLLKNRVLYASEINSIVGK